MTNAISAELLAQIHKLDSLLELPTVRQLVLPQNMLSDSEANAKYDKFGMLELNDNSCGLFYRLLGKQTEQIDHYREIAEHIRGKTAMETACLLNENDNFIRGIGLACINAITQHVYRLAAFDPTQHKEDSTEAPVLSPTTDGHSKPVGLVGYFTQQVRSLRASGQSVVVLELDRSLYRSEEGLVVTDDIELLANCDPIYCTASTLINQTLDGLLARLASDRHIELVGPSAGCLPDVLFEQGVDRVGGSQVLDPELTISRIRQGAAWSSGVEKFSLTSETYPGLDELLRRIKEA